MFFRNLFRQHFCQTSDSDSHVDCRRYSNCPLRNMVSVKYRFCMSRNCQFSTFFIKENSLAISWCPHLEPVLSIHSNEHKCAASGLKLNFKKMTTSCINCLTTYNPKLMTISTDSCTFRRNLTLNQKKVIYVCYSIINKFVSLVNFFRVGIKVCKNPIHEGPLNLIKLEGKYHYEKRGKVVLLYSG